MRSSQSPSDPPCAQPSILGKANPSWRSHQLLPVPKANSCFSPGLASQGTENYEDLSHTYPVSITRVLRLRPVTTGANQIPSRPGGSEGGGRPRWWRQLNSYQSCSLLCGYLELQLRNNDNSCRLRSRYSMAFQCSAYIIIIEFHLSDFHNNSASEA